MKKFNHNYWNQTYAKKKHNSLWPWTDLISLIKRKKKNKNKNVLELGCGKGANIPFFLNENYNYHGLDFSKESIKKLKKDFPILKEKLLLADLTTYNFDNYKKIFGLVIDRGTLTHLKDKEIIELLKKLKKITDKNSIVISCSLYSTNTHGIRKKNIIQHYFSSGKFANLGYVNFFSKGRLKKIFKDWLIISLEKIIIYDFFKKKNIAYWNLMLKRK